MPDFILTRGRDLRPIERPDAILDDTPEAVRSFTGDPAPQADVLELHAAELAALLEGKLVAYTSPDGAITLLLAYRWDDGPPCLPRC